MTGDPFDLFGGTTDLPDDSAEEIDLSQLDALSKPGESEAEKSSSSPESSKPAKKEEAPVEESHWLDLASTLGVAASSTEFEPAPENPPPKSPPLPSRKRTDAPSSRPSSQPEDESTFGRGLLEEIDPSPEESRQQQLLSELFVPTGELDPAAEPEIRQVDDVEFIDEDVVEFEVEELAGDADDSYRGKSRAPVEPDESVAEAAPVPPPRPREHEGRDSNRGRNRDRGESRRRPPRGDRRPDRPRREQPPKVRSEVLPADEDFIIDPIDDETEGEASQQANLKDTKSIKFPTWNETITPIIEANIARRSKNRGDRSRKPSRDRGGRDT